MRLKEHHCISPQRPVPAGGQDDSSLDDGICNAWFPPVELATYPVRCLASTRHDSNLTYFCQGRATLKYRDMGELRTTEHETFEEGQPSSHNENTCLTCRARRDVDESMHRAEDGPRHEDYEDDFAGAGLPRSSYDDDDEEDTYETTCSGIRDIIITGEVSHLFLRRPLAGN